MLAIHRRNEIKKLIEQYGEVSVADLSKRFEVSESTIRRDLDQLESQEIAKKTYGGAVIHEKYLLSQEPLYSVRENTQHEQKKSIARLAATLVADGDVIILDAGTTTSLMVQYLVDKSDLTVVTNSINIAYQLLPHEHIEVIVLGGSLRHRTGSLVGHSVVSALSSFWANKLFLSCSGVSLEGGVTVSNVNSVDVRKQMMKSAASTILLADSSKIGKRYVARVASIDNLSYFITDQPFEEQSAFEALNVKVLYPEKEQ